jgi:methionine-rich copper-binding protein CopC
VKRLALIGAGLAVFLMFLQAGSPSPVESHAFPVRSEPRVGWKVTGSPAKVTIWFDSEIEPAFSTIAVYNAAKQRVDKNNSHVNPSDPTVLEVDLAPLSPGNYGVQWKVLAKDTHVTEGNFSFTVAGP